jgi:hypothetical protein
MCQLDWMLTLEFLKTILSGPVVTLTIAILLLYFFHEDVSTLLGRVESADFFGQKVKVYPPNQQAAAVNEPDELKTEIEEAPANNEPQVVVPNDLADDPEAAGSIAYIHSNAAETYRIYKNLRTELRYEQIFGNIYGTQVNLLKSLNADPETPVHKDAVEKAFAQHKLLAPNTPNSDNWLLFLVNHRLLEVDGTAELPIYRISQFGRDFLSYIKRNYPYIWNSKPF